MRRLTQSDAVKAQQENPNLDIFTGLPFKDKDDKVTVEEKAEEFRNISRRLMLPAKRLLI